MVGECWEMYVDEDYNLNCQLFYILKYATKYYLVVIYI